MSHITMSKKELKQVGTFEQLAKKEITQVMAAQKLKLTSRQIRRKLKRFLKLGAGGLVHKSRGRASTKAWKGSEKDIAISMLQGEWEGFGPTFAAEQLKERYDIKINRETLRKVMSQEGLWQPKKKRSQHRKRRERKEYFGQFIQLDGSPHNWFEERGPRCTLLVFIDDATSKIVWLEFFKSESTKGVALATRHYMEKYGRPQAFYTDFGSVFSVNLNNHDREKITQFERMLNELDVKLARAHSPQAKGRVERANKTLQDRLIKLMRIHDISTIEQANKFAQNTYIEQHNKKFAIPAARSGDMHRSIDQFNLDEIFCIKNVRTLQNDFVVSYKRRILQLRPQQKATIFPKNEVTIHEQFDGTIVLFIRGILLNFVEINQRRKGPEKHEKAFSYRYHKPAANHPWRSGHKHVTSIEIKNQIEAV